jgi:hypothetical protein
MRPNPLKKLLLAAFLTLGVGIVTSNAQMIYSYHDEPTLPWSLPGTIDGSAGIGDYPGNGINFMTQYAVRFTTGSGELITGVNFWLDSILNGVVDSTVSYARPEAAFQWPVPFTHVPQRFTSHAMRFTSPLDNTLQGISVFAGSLTASSDGFNDTLKVSILRPQSVETSTVKYGNENANNSASWNFYFPANSGTFRESYATRFTLPQDTELAEVEFFVGGVNNNSFLPPGDSTPNDSLVVSVWTATETGLPDQKLGEVLTGISILDEAAWNTVSLSSLGIQNEIERELIIAFQLKVVGLIDHVGISAGASFATPLNRSLVLENGNWVTIAASSAYSGGGARGAELWTRAKYTPLGQGGQPLPDEENPVIDPIFIPMTEVTPDRWLDIDLSSSSVSFDQNDEFWVTVELISVGSPDTFSFISGNPEPSPTFRSAARIDNGDGSSEWTYMADTQFEKEYHFRIQADFQVPGDSEITDDVLVIFYSDENGLPDEFLGLKTIPLASLEVGSMNNVDVSDLELSTSSADIHVAISSIIENNQFALASDAGSTDPAQNRTSAYFLANQRWKSLASVDGSPGEVNMAIELVTQLGLSIDETDNLPTQTKLMANYPNPFNPTTQIPFSLAESGNVTLEVFDLTGKRVALLADGQFSQGNHAVMFSAESLASGVYVARMTTGQSIQTIKLMLIK